ncbi:hypothetical protein BC830DRAFT_114237 [Chytriomyces sp. MP71]|nr:hypothetical protein BC830DRAFT_114237 [Chytriomyces sp. MP71]
MALVSLTMILLVFKGLFARGVCSHLLGPSAAFECHHFDGAFTQVLLLLQCRGSSVISGQVVEMYTLIYFLLWATPGQVMRGYSKHSPTPCFLLNATGGQFCFSRSHSTQH